MAYISTIEQFGIEKGSQQALEKMMPYISTIEQFGIEKGMQKGIEKGYQQTLKRIISHMLNLGQSKESICKLLGLKPEETHILFNENSDVAV